MSDSDKASQVEGDVMPDEGSHEINGYRLERTCFACPEQYDVYKGDEQVGYLRLRHGGFRAEYPNCMGETVYLAEPKGDGLFEPEERRRFLTEAVEALDKRHNAR